MYNWKSIEKYILDGHTIKQASIVYGFSLSALDKARKKNKLYLPTDTIRKNRGPRAKDISEYLIKGSHIKTTHLKNRLIKEGMLKGVCKKCGINQWLGNDITLQLDHINGDNCDNRIENLRLLCPNCHSQTPTFDVGIRKLTLKKVLAALNKNIITPEEARSMVIEELE